MYYSVFEIEVTDLFKLFCTVALTSIDMNARNGSETNLLNWNKFIVVKYEYLVTLVVIKNTAFVKNINWPKFTIDTKIGHSFKYKKIIYHMA